MNKNNSKEDDELNMSFDAETILVWTQRMFVCIAAGSLMLATYLLWQLWSKAWL